MRIKIRKPHRKEKIARPSAGWPTAYRWAAMGTLVACSAMGNKAVLSAQDITRPNPTRRPKLQTQGRQPVYRFDIPASSLDAAAASFQRTTSFHVTVSNSAIGRVASPGVTGLCTPEQALQRLLAGTGLSYRFTAPETVLLDIAEVVQSVDVAASVDELAESSPKYSATVLDTPQTITEVSSQVMQDQGVTTLRDSLRNVAGISLAAGEGSAQGDNLTIRGFTARNDLYIDGMRDFGSYYRDPFNTREVEVLQGPSSVTFGRGSTGGVVNQATKMPSLSGFLSASIDVGTDLTRRGTLDFDGPFNLLGHSAAFRLNLMGNLNDVAGRDVAENRRFGVAPSLSLGLDTNTRLTLAYFHQNADDTPDYGIPWLFNGPAPVPRSNYYGFEHGNFLRTDDDIGTVRLEHDFAHGITLREQGRYADYVRDALITEPQIISTATLAAPASG
ncbi:MAG TPA: TonB-dependent receptor plug domain-containing protein, partial [Bryobacteraceae bacterium]